MIEGPCIKIDLKWTFSSHTCVFQGLSSIRSFWSQGSHLPPLCTKKLFIDWTMCWEWSCAFLKTERDALLSLDWWRKWSNYEQKVFKPSVILHTLTLPVVNLPVLLMDESAWDLLIVCFWWFLHLKATGEVKDIFVHIDCGHLSDWFNDITSRVVLSFLFSLYRDQLLCGESHGFSAV